jgi:malto-oligosyltrehalose synthase/4-alpha-glucanotransferase
MMEQKPGISSIPEYNPVATYRIQFTSSFTLKDLEDQIDYLSALGISSIYASPVFAAAPGSGHGYDVIDPGMVNPELGTYQDLTRVIRRLKEKGIGWIQDIVPNHMAFHPDNPWIWDLLEKGASSRYISIFDLELSASGPDGRIMLPFLGQPLEKATENDELQFIMHRGNLAVKYYDNLYPVNFSSFRTLFSSRIPSAPAPLQDIWQKYDLDEVNVDGNFLNQKWEAAKKEIEQALAANEALVSFTADVLQGINKNPQLGLEILGRQHYELCYWKETSRRINYRRFFTINGLICIRIEDEEVFTRHHKFLKELLDGGYLTGLRVDHIDGLQDPGQYLRRLRAMAGEESYLIVEKILEHGENLPSSWPVEGTSGYDFLALVNNLLTPKKEHKRLTSLYHNITGSVRDPGLTVYNNKKFILDSGMQGELDNIFSHLERLVRYASDKKIATYNENKITPVTMRQALAGLMASFPVYRYYPEEFPLNGKTRELMDGVFSSAIERNPDLKNSLGMLKELLFIHRPGDTTFNDLLKGFCLRLMQFTGPLTAKGVEDTTMYQYNCHVAHNEVGDSPWSDGISADQFHEAMIVRNSQIPLSMNATSTHDTKRGEDVRARLNALAGMAGSWESLVKEWMEINAGLKSEDGRQAPTPNEEYLIYQTLAGTFPFDEKPDETYKQRIREYLVKALREAKQTSNWDDPDEAHEKGVCDFATSLLTSRSKFLDTFIPFHRKLAWRGVVNSLVQLVIKSCSPGTPDIYRGTELWDLSLVDPDNRRPVDFARLQDILGRSLLQWDKDPAKATGELYRNAFDGRIKQLLTHLLLKERKNNPDLFHYGDYIPLQCSGKYKTNVLAFIRKLNDTWLLCILPLHAGALSSGKEAGYPASADWKDTLVTLPPGAPRDWKNIFTGENSNASKSLEVGPLFRELPVAVLTGQTDPSERRSGVLLHVSSLPGQFGTGDFGPEAYRFVDFLSVNNQTYWQILPLSPVTGAQSWSPYSSPSAFAGNILLVSPEILFDDGLVNGSDLENSGFRQTSRVNFEKTLAFKETLLEKAWDRIRKNTGNLLYRKFEEFCEKESWWLEDFALFMTFRKIHREKDWGRWPAEVKNREKKTIRTAGYEHDATIMLEKFKQFIFNRQWLKLKEYANNKGILIFGDIPYYVSYDSAEVWAHQDLFNLDGKGKMKTVAGVPPDYFDKNGQLWNMPVYNWDRLREGGYDWWLKRLARNLEFYDLLRLDHFRGFSAFWEVPAKDKTAINGKWTRGPGSDFFRAVEREFPSMPFVAEDLGDIDQPVYDLRDEFFLPGMQVLQFTFDDNMAKNLHTPHNHKSNSLVYTGTHDNNTLQGWYKKEIGSDRRKRLAEYLDKNITRSTLNREMIRMAFASPARTCIIPMQDYLGLGREARMNTPSTSSGNWIWKLKTAAGYKSISGIMAELTVIFNRR